MPLGMQSEWARNVIAAGQCRVQLHDQVFDLDEPAMVDAGEARDLPWPLRRVMAALGFKYLSLRTLAVHPAAVALIEAESHDSDLSSGTEGSAVDRNAVLSVTLASVTT